jgi:NAD(P)H-dependent FMN reductase
MKICVIVGSARAGSNSRRIADRLAGMLHGTGEADVDVLDLHAETVDLWSEDFDDPASDEAAQWKPVAARLRSADGFVIVSPEYAGMAPPVLMNLLMKCSWRETAHKPALLVAVSSGAGGSYPIAELRQFGFKNNFVCMIPFNVIVRNADALFCGKPESRATDDALSQRMSYGASLLLGYAGCLATLRASGAADPARYPYGM